MKQTRGAEEPVLECGGTPGRQAVESRIQAMRHSAADEQVGCELLGRVNFVVVHDAIRPGMHAREEF